MERNPKTETNPFLPQNLSGGDGGAKIYRLRLLLASSIDRRQQVLIPGGTIIARIDAELRFVATVTTGGRVKFVSGV